MIGVPAYILYISSPILQPDFESVDKPRFEVKSFYAFIEKLPLLTPFVELKITLLFNEALAGLGVRAYYENLSVFISITSNGER